MSVKTFIFGQAVDHQTSLSGIPKEYVCDTWAERPTSGLIGGSRCFVLEDGKIYRATNATTWVEIGGSQGGSAWGDITGTLSAQSDLQAALDAKGTSNFSGAYGDLSGIPSTFTPSAHSHPATGISDSTVTGRSLITAADAAAARTAIGAGTSSFDGAYPSLTSIPATFAPIIGAGGTQACAGNDARLSDARTPVTHAAAHKSGGGDAIRLDELAAPTNSVSFNAQQATNFRIENRTIDPGVPTVGQIWLRTDL